MADNNKGCNCSIDKSTWHITFEVETFGNKLHVNYMDRSYCEGENASISFEINYCPFCGRKINKDEQ